MNDLAPLAGYRLVTMLGKWPLTNAWVAPCMKSWARLYGAAPSISVISDGSLEQSDLQGLDLGNDLHFDPNLDRLVTEVLRSYPNLLQMRQQDLTWRKLTDVAILHQESKKILLIDSDVYVRRLVCLPNVEAIIYLREGIPAFQASPEFPLQVPMVRSFNSGLVLFDPQLMDFDFLEFLAKRYFISLKNPWWSEQAAWSALAARTTHRFFWSGEDAVTLSGTRSRSQDEIRQNVVKPFSSSRPATPEEILVRAGEASVVHLAGLAQKSWKVFASEELHETGVAKPMSAHADPCIGLLWKLVIATRLLVKRLRPE